MEKYLKDSARTAGANKLHTELVPIGHIINALQDAKIISSAIDQSKKGLFYGKDTDDLHSVRALHGEQHPNSYLGVDVDLLHAVLGILTEANELGELLLEHLKMPSFQTVDKLRDKLLNESGDELWYLALLFRRLGVTFEEVGDMNTEKLLKRFPEKFTEDLAIHRDESKENVVFQQT